jgi:hypothetical protein
LLSETTGFVNNITHITYIFVWRKLVIPVNLVFTKAGSGNSVGAVREPPLHPSLPHTAGPLTHQSPFFCYENFVASIGEMSMIETKRRKKNAGRDSGR